MASHHTPGNIVPIHRGIADQPRDYPARPVDLYKSLEQPRRGLLDRIADWLGTDRGFGFALGLYAGVMLCCGSLILWVAVLK